MGYMLFGAMISYYSPEFDGFIFCSVDPTPPSVTIPRHDVIGGRLTIRGKVDPTIVVANPFDDAQRRVRKAVAGKKKRSRMKERKIGQVIDQVMIWRRYYNGYTDYHGKQVKLSLDEAAAKVGVPKKSLDDYFLQLRMGRKYGFNFNANKDENVGVLRAFIKEQKGKTSGVHELQ
eukprot:TRINITY_DN3568_c0_g5_i3.p1 TRINITY_DN3568_c0_g5~~TRINITY_DN3568_c0_g5_i3.p1  ORF type:complete len:175 (-),score=53.20 TRINITY_DN3568_c0_g5_i3:115-639(-)